MRMRTTITWKGTLQQTLLDFDEWRKADPERTKSLLLAPAKLTIIAANYPVTPKHRMTVTGQRELWPEEKHDFPAAISDALAGTRPKPEARKK
jgi:hypothetical protein